MMARCICGSRLVGGYCAFSLGLLSFSLLVLGFVIVWRIL